MSDDAPRLELWQRAILARVAERRKHCNQGARARMDLVAILVRAGYAVPLVVVHTWSRDRQGQAYLWALAFTGGREDIPPPAFVVDAAERPGLAKAWPAAAGARWRIHG